MNWIKRNLFWIIGLLVFALIVLGSLLALKKQIVQRDDVVKQLDSQTGELKRLVGLPHYPSNHNVNQMREDNEQLTKKLDAMIAELAKAQVPSEPLTGIKFREFINKRTQILGRRARQQAIAIPVNYLFSFDRYESKIPDNADVPLLMKQLNVIEEIANTLFTSSRVLLLDSIARADFEDYDAAEVARGARRSPGEFTEMPNGYNGIQNDPAKMYTIMPFDIQFATDPEGLRNFINNLTHSKFVLVPEYAKIRCDQLEVKEQTKPPEVGPGGEIITPISPEAINVERATKFVLGLEKINVQMRLDWYEFRLPEEKGKSRREKKPEGEEAKPAAPTGGEKK